MSGISPRAVRLLRHFADAKNHALSVRRLQKLLPGDEYEYRLGELIEAGLVEVGEYEAPTTHDGIIDMGAPTAFRMTVKGQDYLSAMQHHANEKRKQKAYADRAKRAKQKQAVVDKKKQFRHDFKVATYTVVLTLTLEHFRDVFNFLKGALKPIIQFLFH